MGIVSLDTGSSSDLAISPVVDLSEEVPVVVGNRSRSGAHTVGIPHTASSTVSNISSRGSLLT